MGEQGVVEMTEEERAIIEAKRKHEANVRACTDEINAVLDKYGLVMNIATNPQVSFVPKAG